MVSEKGIPVHSLKANIQTMKIRQMKLIDSKDEEIETNKEDIPAVKVILVVTSYALTLTSLAFIDKALLTTYSFNFPFFILSCQMIFTILAVEILRLSGIVSLSGYTLSKGWEFMLPSTCYWLNAVLSMVALSGMNIPMFGVVRRCEPLALLILGSIILKKEPPSFLVILAIFLITGGCVLAASGDLAFDTKAYICGFSSIVTQAIYLTLVQMRCQDDLSTLETLQLNSYNTLPFLIAISCYSNEITRIRKYNYNDMSFIVTFACTISFGCFLNYTMFLCTSVTSALTTSVVGTIKSLAQTVIGLYTFGGVQMNSLAILGMTLNLIGGFFYTFAKLKGK